MADPVVIVAFNVLATLFAAFSVAYLTEDLVGLLAEKRIVAFATGPVTRPVLRAAVVLFEGSGIAMLVWLTFAVALEPQTPSPVNIVTNWAALGFEVFAILRGLARMYRAMRIH